MANEINGEDVSGMVKHWLGCPVNGYLGSSYGSDALALLQKPMASGLGDAFIRKMETDIPLVGSLRGGVIDIHFERVSNQRKRLLINVAGNLVTVDDAGNTL